MQKVSNICVCRNVSIWIYCEKWLVSISRLDLFCCSWCQAALRRTRNAPGPYLMRTPVVDLSQREVSAHILRNSQFVLHFAILGIHDNRHSIIISYLCATVPYNITFRFSCGCSQARAGCRETTCKLRLHRLWYNGGDCYVQILRHRAYG